MRMPAKHRGRNVHLHSLCLEKKRPCMALMQSACSLSVHTSYSCLSDDSERLVDFCDLKMPSNLWRHS